MAENVEERRNVYMNEEDIQIQDIEDTIALRQMRRVTTNNDINIVMNQWKKKFSLNTYQQTEA